MADLGSNLIKLTFALLKHQAKIILGEEALGIVAETMVEIGGETITTRLESVLGTKDGATKLLEAAQKADKCFHNKCEDNDLRQALSIPLGDLTSVQDEIAKLPANVDEDSLRETLHENLKRNFPKLTKDQIESGVNLYVDCLRRALVVTQRLHIIDYWECRLKQ